MHRSIDMEGHKQGMDYQEAISQLKNLDLRTYPHEEVKNLIRMFGKFGVIQMILHPGKSIIRARPMNPGDKFNTRASLSYKPAEYNKSYQRASTPLQTMFYGSDIPIDLPREERVNARIVSALETCDLLRDHVCEGEQLVTFSKWVVKDDIPLIAICYHKDFVNKSLHTKDLYDAYLRDSHGLDADTRRRSVAVTEYLAGEFAKKEISHDYEYLVSAVFAETCLRNGMAGVYYPSVRADAKGYNVAIAPEFVDKRLRLVAAGECTIYKRGDYTIGDNDTLCMVEDDSRPFEFIPVPRQYHMGRENVMKEFDRRMSER